MNWEFENFKSAVTIGEKTLYHSQRHQVMSTFRKHRCAMHLDALLQLPSQGNVMDCVANERSRSHILQTGDFIRFADWRFIHRARLNLLLLNGSRHHDHHGNKSCRHCCYESKTLLHVINHCMRYAELITRRHNVIVSRVRKAAQQCFTILAENETVVGNLRPDLVLVRQGQHY